MTPEEKAKRFDEALAKAKAFAIDLPNGRNDRLYHIWDLETIFPELKENKDEKIRKALIRFHKSTIDIDGIKGDDIVAWLEKQGEHAKFRDSIQVGDKVTRNQDGVLVNLSQLKRIAKSTEEYNITGIGSKHAEGKLGEMIRNLKPLGETMQKSAWSEEDENILQGIWDEILANKHDAKKYDWKTYDKFLDWLKSLKERVQPKQEWSEEDALRLEEVMYMIEANGRWVRSDNVVKLVLDWLKSLKDKYTWKPSDEQMIALRQAICGCYDIEPLLELEKQLKKL